MSLRRSLRRLERLLEGEYVTIPQRDGSVKRFPESALADAFLAAHYRASGHDVPDHPLSQACRRSSDPKWRETVYAEGETVAEEVPDLSE